MTEKSTKTLRERAEAMLSASRADIAEMTPEDIQVLVHELQVHQMQLEIQNEELREAQVELSESRDRFSDLYEFAPVGYVTLDAAGKILEANLRAATKLGVDRQSLIRRPLSDFVDRDAQNAWYLHRQAVFASDSRQSCELAMHKADGTALVLQLDSIAFGSPPDRRCRTALINITARKQVELALRDNDERLRSILDTAAEAIITIDQRGLMTSFNAAAEKMFGYSAAEAVGQNVKVLMPPPYRDEHDTYVARYLTTRQPRIIGISREVTGLRKDGSTFPMDLSVSEIEHHGFTGIVRDNSERKELQRQILEIISEEQHRIGNELHDGTQQELTGISLIAGTLLELLNATPEVRTADQTVWRLDKQDHQRLCEIAKILSQRLSEANQHVRQLAHGIMPVPVEREGLRSVLTVLADSTNSLPGITCRFDCPEPVAVADNSTATHLFRLAQEAVTNALKHSRANEIRISLQQQNGQIILEVNDNGLGISATATNCEASTGETPGMGLRIMNYRAGMIGGMLHVERI
ncbi:MAG: PAS domain S-box protein, partial [Planctomycetaceae bacterium]|nr:PAS domain S-box protein [Planctomycetaceae bacterium]